MNQRTAAYIRAARDPAENIGDSIPADITTTEDADELLRVFRDHTQALERAALELEDDEAGGITPEGTALGHRYVMGNVNAYCPKCSQEHSDDAGHSITVLDCDYDLSK
jgi:hypothetical protein